jgi:glutamyl-tRNA(Gln) amidotransferase subunit E
MYPETDIPPIFIDRAWLESLKLKLPELIEDRAKRFVQQYGISRESADQLITSDRANLFEFLTQWAHPKLVASMLTVILTNLKREGFDVERLEQGHFVELLKAINEGRAAKEAIPEILKVLTKNPNQKIEDVLKQLKIESLSETELRKIVREIIKQKPEIKSAPNAVQVYMGIVMAKVRGRISGQIVARILKEELETSP